MMYYPDEPFRGVALRNHAFSLSSACLLGEVETEILTRMLDETVTRGVQVLDRTFPKWWERIDLNVLEIADPCRCLLGQLMGNYAHAVLELGIAWRGGDYGFATHTPILNWLAGISRGTSQQDFTLYYHLLTELWKARIQLLRKERTGSEWKELIPEQETVLDRVYRPQAASQRWSISIGTTLAVVP